MQYNVGFKFVGVAFKLNAVCIVHYHTIRYAHITIYWRLCSIISLFHLKRVSQVSDLLSTPVKKNSIVSTFCFFSRPFSHLFSIILRFHSIIILEHLWILKHNSIIQIKVIRLIKCTRHRCKLIWIFKICYYIILLPQTILAS